MSAHVLLNLLNELRKRDKMKGLPSILSLLATKLTLTPFCFEKSSVRKGIFSV